MKWLTVQWPYLLPIKSHQYGKEKIIKFNAPENFQWKKCPLLLPHPSYYFSNHPIPVSSSIHRSVSGIKIFDEKFNKIHNRFLHKNSKYVFHDTNWPSFTGLIS